MNPMEMTDVELQAHALRMWANRVETGNPDLSAEDHLAMKKEIKINREGMRFALRLRDLADKIEGVRPL